MKRNAISWAAALLLAAGGLVWAKSPQPRTQPRLPEPLPAPIATRTTRDLTLDEAVQIALRQNPDILRSEQEIKRTRGQVIEVRAQALPQVTVTSGYTKEDKALLSSGGGTVNTSNGAATATSGTGASSSSKNTGSNTSTNTGSSTGLGGSSSNPNTDAWNVTVTARQLIYSGGQVGAAIHIAKFAQDAALYSLRDVVDTTISTVRKQFYAVLLDRAIINVQEESLKLLGSQLSDQQNRFQAGTVPRFNVLQAEVAVANARPQLIQARNDYNIAELNLARTLGISTGYGTVGVPPINPQGILTTEEKPIPLAAALDVAKERRPFLKVQREQILIQVENIKVALAGYQPTLEADGGYEVHNASGTRELDRVVNGWFFGVTGTWNIWDSGATYGRTKQAKAQLEEARVSYDDAVQQVNVEVEQAFDQVRESQDTIVSQEKAIEEAQEALRLSDERLRAGAGTQLDVLSSQVALVQSRTTLVQAQYNYNIAMAEFDRVTGASTRWAELFDDPLVRAQKAKESRLLVK